MKKIATAIVGAGCLISGSISLVTMPGQGEILAWALLIVGAVACFSATVLNNDSSDEEETKE